MLNESSMRHEPTGLSSVYATIRGLRKGYRRNRSCPHKLFLLLALGKLYDSMPARSPRFCFGPELESAFEEVCNEWESVVGPEPVLLEYPFYHLKSDGFWKLHIISGMEPQFEEWEKTRLTRKRLIDAVEYAELSGEFASLLSSTETRSLVVSFVEEQIRLTEAEKHDSGGARQMPISSSYNDRKGSQNSDHGMVGDQLARFVFSSPLSGMPNPFVAYLNSLHSCDAGNENALAEAQAVNRFFGRIQVEHPLCAMVVSKLKEGSCHVILTGHAGDGKSTIALDAFKQLKDLPGGEPLSVPLKPREEIRLADGRTVVIVKDLSEWDAAGQQQLIKDAVESTDHVFLFVTNTGTLLGAFREYERSHSGDGTVMENRVLEAIDSREPCDLLLSDVPFLTSNLAMHDNLDIAEKVFRRMVDESNWQPCAGLDCAGHCPIRRNVQLIRDNLDTVSRRLFLAYRRMAEYGLRLTLRQLVAHMAYMITAGLDYGDIVEMGEPGTHRLCEFLFFNRFFGDDGIEVDPAATQLRAVKEVRRQGFGLRPCPSLERNLWLRVETEAEWFRGCECAAEFQMLRELGAGKQQDDAVGDAEARQQVRRMLFFLHAGVDESDTASIKAFLNSPMVVDFDRWQRDPASSLPIAEMKRLCNGILHVLQEHFTGVRLPEGSIDGATQLHITLNRCLHEIRQSAQVVLATLVKQDFVIEMASCAHASGTRRVLVLKYRQVEPLELDLPFLDYVMMRSRGEVGQDIQASYVDRLEHFKGQLLKNSTQPNDSNVVLVRMRTSHRFVPLELVVTNNSVEVL